MRDRFPAAQLTGFIRSATRAGCYGASQQRLLLTAISQTLKEIETPDPTVADVERWLSSPVAFSGRLSAQTRATYISRAQKVVRDFLRWDGDLAAWQRQTSTQQELPLSREVLRVPAGSNQFAEITFPRNLSTAERRQLGDMLAAIADAFRTQEPRSDE